MKKNKDKKQNYLGKTLHNLKKSTYFNYNKKDYFTKSYLKSPKN